MKRKLFYTMQGSENSSRIGIEEKDGFEFEFMSEKLYGYVEDDHVYIIDPKTGMSIIDDFIEEITLEKDKIVWQADKLLKEKERLKIFLDKRNTPEYKIMEKRFMHFKNGMKMHEKLNNERRRIQCLDGNL